MKMIVLLGIFTDGDLRRLIDKQQGFDVNLASWGSDDSTSLQRFHRKHVQLKRLERMYVTVKSINL